MSIKRRKLSHDSDEPAGTTDQSRSRVEESHARVQAGPVPENPLLHNSTSLRGINVAGTTDASITAAMQIEGLLEEVSLDYDDELKSCKPLVDKICRAVKAIPDQSEMSLAQAKKILKEQGVVLPFINHEPPPDVKYRFAFSSPSAVLVTGLLPLHIGVEGCSEVEIAVQMPMTLFQEKDYLDYRAFHKRSFYLGHLAVTLMREVSSEYGVEFALKDGNSLLPVLRMTSVGDGLKSSNTFITIDVTFPQSMGPLGKLLPSRCCVRPNAETDADGKLAATPFYNSSIRSHACVGAYHDMVHNASSRCQAFLDACRLGSLWLKRRGLDDSIAGGGFGPRAWAQLCALLLTSGGHRGRGLFSDRYSALNLFKAMLQLFAARDFLEQPWCVGDASLQLERSDNPIILDSATGVNILYRMSPWSNGLLRHHAVVSLSAINVRSQANFDRIFLLNVAASHLQYDEIYSVDISEHINAWKADGQIILRKLYDILKKGLGDRVTLLVLRPPAAVPFRVSEHMPNWPSTLKIEVSIILNRERADQTVDHGPTAEEQDEAMTFRQFWGEKSELRRFRDGRITETLVWSEKTPIILQIIRHLTARHLKLTASAIEAKTPSLRNMHLSPGKSSSVTIAFRTVGERFQELSSTLHHLNDLPLPIRSISAADEALCSMSLASPLQPSDLTPIDVLIQFDSSTRWPDHLPAIQYTKVAFLAKLGTLLIAQDQTLETQIGIESPDTSQTGLRNTSFLDITYPASGSSPSRVTFRLRILQDRELSLLETRASSKDNTSMDREKLSAAILSYKRANLAAPLHTTTIRTLATHFSAISATVRLLKSWIAAHNLTNHIPAPALEIIVSHVFFQPAPWTAPNSTTTGFVRCIHFLAHWDWTVSPLITDLSLTQDMDQVARQQLETRFRAWRKMDPAMNTVAWFIGTNLDATGTIWTQGARPASVVAGRVTALARAALTVITSKGTSMETPDWNSIFISSLADFDFVLHLKPEVAQNTSRTDGHSTRFKNLQIQQEMDVSRTGLDPVARYLGDLESTFGASTLFFHGEGESVIAGLWKPSIQGRKDWRVRLGYSSIPAAAAPAVENNAAPGCEFNFRSTMSEIGMLGEGIVQKITCKNTSVS